MKCLMSYERLWWKKAVSRKVHPKLKSAGYYV